MIKKFGFLLILILVVLSVVLFFRDNNNGKPHNKDYVDHIEPPREEKPSQSDQNNNLSSESLVSRVFLNSKEGRVPGTSFVAGQTEIQEINHEWGNAEKTTTSEKGNYAHYPKYDVTVGYHEQLIFDVRSFHSELQNIHLKDIKKVKGDPDEVRYYKGKTHNQIILVYHVNEEYELKWILPKPSDREPNPRVHHISVFTQISNKDHNQGDNYEVISDMSLSEKIGQMMITGISGTKINQNTKTLINKYKVGGIIFYGDNLETPQQTVHLLNQIKFENKHNRFPLLLSVDEEGGRISRMPGNITDLPTNKEIGAINNPHFSYEIGTLLGKELNEFGFNLDFAPVLDVNSNPNNPIIGDRSFGNNPKIVSKLGIQTMKGIQSQNIVPVIKHFPGHGDTSVDSHLNLPKVNKNLEDLNELEIIPFKNAIDNGAEVVMVAHILLPKIDAAYPSSMSEKIISDILRKQLDFNGVVMTDDMTMKAITNHFDIGQAAIESVKAGSDIILVAHDYNKILSTIDALKTAVQKGEIPEERINASVNRIIQLKKNYNINNEEVEDINIKELNQSIENVLNKEMSSSTTNNQSE
ncbi:beta-N-acetylhexosaminidase [Rossellomorea sp. BNER]|uniref:beta-N-acetylhexosaminidase n=1 Tax=Rossellomorea sp. BNER TaxID=2962031 RepID=UPI003AF20C76|nr:beta-N-acetylhexosaminidase [Rossellomorea sp. BNER]